MTRPVDSRSRLPLYEGRGFPLHGLSPAEFEGFVFGCLLCVADLLGMRIDGKPSGSGDGGFDIQGREIGSGRLACVQCKRQESPLDTTQAARELAKVAATAALERSDVGTHRFICTGGIRTKLRSHLREQSRRQIALAAAEQLTNAPGGELASLRDRLRDHGMDPQQVAESYVLGLSTLSAWDTSEFDTALSRNWADVLEVANRYFRIATVVREHPRAFFDRAAYIAEHRDFKAVFDPLLTTTPLPDSIAVADSLELDVQPAGSQRTVKAVHDLLDIEAGELLFLIGQGGAGKSFVLALLRAECLRAKPDSTLPVLITLANYTAGKLDEAIHRELGVEHGKWHALPDQLLLLCDGLNECSFENATQFLHELTPHLKRKRVSCIISTRESMTYRAIRLSYRPAACVKVQTITPVAIRRIAESRLSEQAAEDFILAYRLLADRSWSSHLWTPFSAFRALRLWQLQSKLPSTLSEILDALLRSRCDRDGAVSGMHLAPDVILRFAGALAFQSLVVDRRLECPALEAGRWLQTAKGYCTGAFGVAEMTDAEAVTLMTQHELLSLSKDGHFRFEHQFLAGALAAPILASAWKQHIHSIGESVADDAWVFAARLVPSDQIEEFLQVTFNADLMLGARAARELPSSYHGLAERLLGRAIAPESPETVRVRGLFALGRLGTSGAIEKLRTSAMTASDSQSYTAALALAAAGDVPSLRELLPEVDRLRSMPMTVSGGNIGIWEAAPIATRLDLARRRLSECRTGDPVKESLRLVAYERDPDDIELIERHLRAASDLSAFHAGLYALHAVAPARAEGIYQEVLATAVEPPARAQILRVAAYVGIKVDIREVFACAIADVPSDFSASHSVQLLISDVLAKMELPPDLAVIVETQLPSCAQDKKARLWQIANGCNSPTIASYAEVQLETLAEEWGNACNFFISQPERALARRPQLIECCERIFADEKNWFMWSTQRAFALIGMLGFTGIAAASLSAMIHRLSRIRQAHERGDPLSLSPHESELLKTTKPEHMRFRLADLAGQLIRAAAEARPLLSSDARLSLLYFDTHSQGTAEDLQELLSDVDDTSIDQVLSRLTDSWVRISALVVACTRGATDTRIKLLALELRHGYAHPAVMHLLQKATEACWCGATLDMVVHTIADIPIWREQDAQFFWDFAQMVARRVEPSSQSVLEKALATARTSFAKRILALWHDHALGTRIGLSRILKA